MERHHERWSARIAAIAFAASVFCSIPALAQHPFKRAPKGINKNTTPVIRQNFTGVVQSLDKKRKILTVESSMNNDTEYFPVNRHVRVITANGRKVRWAALATGLSVMVNFREQNGRRAVQRITILKNEAAKTRRKGHHPF